VGQDEGHAGMSRGEACELHAVGCLLPRPVAPAVLPDVLEDRGTSSRRFRSDRIEQRIIGATTGGELDADRTAREASLDLTQRVLAIVRIHGDIAANAIAFPLLQGHHLIVAHRHVGGRREIDRRRVAPAAEDRSDVHRDADAFAGAEPRRIPFAPILSAAPRVQKVGVNLDQRLASRQRLVRQSRAHSSSRRRTSAELAALSIPAMASSSWANDGKS
jgi:hypothetical protein